MPNLLSDFLENLSECYIRQTLGVDDKPERSAVGKFMRHTGGENPIEYEITTREGELLGLAQEQKGHSLIPYSIRNSFIGKRRPMVFLIKNEDDEVLCCLRRLFYVFASKTIVKDYNNKVLAYILGQFNPLYQKYQLRGGNKKLLATISSPIWKWTFPVLNVRKKPLGMITRKLPSMGEAMTYRDRLSVQFPDQAVETKLFVLALAFTIAIEH